LDDLEAKEKEEEEKKQKSLDERKEEKKGEDEGAKEDKETKVDISDEQLELQKKAKEYLEAKNKGEGGEDEKARGKKRKRKRSSKEYDENDDTSGSDSSDEDDGDEELPPGAVKKEDDKCAEPASAPETKAEDNGNGHKEGDGEEAKVEVKVEEGEEGEDKDRPRALHRTASIFLRNLAPTITKQEVEAMCKRYPGFLRAAIADPQADRRWFRRGWITFERDVKIKEICYNLNNIRLRDCELGPIVNRDLTRRIRTVNGVTVDRKVVRNDIKLAAKVITNLDKRWNLWQLDKKEGADSGGNEVEKEENIGVGSTNPVLQNITDYLIEEASAEEEELLGKNNDLEDGEEGEEGNSLARDDDLIKVLDRLLYYLRIVFSVDFYNHSEYPNEDEMPNRCGIMHARGLMPTGKVAQSEIEDYCAAFEKKMGSFLQPKSLLNDEEANKLGMKSEDDEVEKFVQANTQVRHFGEAQMSTHYGGLFISGIGQRQVALPALWQEVQGPGLCAQAHFQQARREGGRGQARGAVLQQLLEGSQEAAVAGEPAE